MIGRATDWTDTIVAPATAEGMGFRAIVRVSGPAAHTIADKVWKPLDPAPIPWARTLARSGQFELRDWHRPVAATVYSWAAGRSATGQPMVEFHLPAPGPLVAAALATITAAGARLAQPGEFTLRAFLAGRLDLAQAEGVLGLVDAATAAQLAFAIDQRTGGLSRPVAAVRADLLDLLADVEAGLDFADEDIAFVARDDAVRRVNQACARLSRLAADLSARAVAMHRPRLVLVGWPNAGKSSLFNALTGRRALVSAEAGTTRDYLVANLALDGQVAELVDTGGVETERAGDVISLQAAARRRDVVRDAALLLWCMPVGSDADWRVLPIASDLAEHPRPASRVIRIRTMTDRDAGFSDPTADARVSALTGAGIADLRRLLAVRLAAAVGDLSGMRSAERCRASLEQAVTALAETTVNDGPEVLAVHLREALEHLGEIVGAVYTNDLLDRMFSRFCIGK